ncbi:MAG: lamin tail domain-containing protein [Byssovorax sp.]
MSHLDCPCPAPRALAALLAFALQSSLLVACRPDLGPLSAAGDDPSAPAPAPPSVTLSIDPPAPLDAAPRVLRLRLSASGSALDPARIALVEGDAGPAQLRQVQRDEISKTLEKRLVPVQIWREEGEGQGGAGGAAAGISALLVAPAIALSPGQRYTLLVAEPAALLSLTIDPDDPAPLLPRLWPPPGGSATASFGLWCGDEPLPFVAIPASLAPAGPAGRIQRGVPGDPALGPRCVHFEAPEPLASDEGGLPVPALLDGASTLRLDPRPLTADADPHPIEPLLCAEGELPFGPGCATVSDDRLAVRSPGVPLLWAIGGPDLDRVKPTGPEEPFLLTGLAPASAVSLRGAVIDDRGATFRFLFDASTLPPRPHVLLNEVLANPLGAEPQQEWVELYNDGSAEAELGGHVLVDIGGETVLPAGVLAPGGYALVVNSSFVEDDGFDPAPAQGTLILHVPKLGHAGLANAGEPLSLRDAAGSIISRFPPGPKPKAGMSLARLRPDAPDDVPAGFAPSTPTPGGTNGE